MHHPVPKPCSMGSTSQMRRPRPRQIVTFSQFTQPEYRVCILTSGLLASGAPRSAPAEPGSVLKAGLIICVSKAWAEGRGCLSPAHGVGGTVVNRHWALGTEGLPDALSAVRAAGRGAPVGSTTSLLELGLSEPLSLSVNWGFSSTHPGVDEDETG